MNGYNEMDAYLKIYQTTQLLLNDQQSFLTEADVQSSVKKASSDCAAKITAMDNLKAKIFQSNTQYLDLYREKAKSTNPTGLVLHNYKYAKFEIVKKNAERVMEMIKQKENEAICIQDIPNIKRWLDENITHNGLYNSIFSILYSNIKNKKDISVFLDIQSKHQVSKSDVYRAIRNLESCKEDIDELEKFYKDMDIEYKTKLDSYDKGIISGTLDSNLEEYYQTVEANCIALKRIASNEVYRIYMKLYKINQKTDKVILRKVANYNPRNIKESAELQDEIDLEYELNNIEDDL